MKKTIFCIVSLVLAFISTNVSAYDILKKSILSTEITSIEGLSKSTFTLSDADGMYLYTPSGWDIKVGNEQKFTSSEEQGGLYKLVECDGGHWFIHVYDMTGTPRKTNIDWYNNGDQYVNAQPDGNVIFGLRGPNSDQYGMDGPNLAVWDITYEAGKGFAFHCVGRDIYIGRDAEAARPVSEIYYWNAMTTPALIYNADEVEATYDEIKDLSISSSVKTAMEAAKQQYNADKSDENLSIYGDAVNAAIRDLIYADIKAGDYIIKNVSTGTYLGGANDWGTQASLLPHGKVFTVSKLDGGKYKLDSHTYNSATAHFFNGTYVDNGDAEPTKIELFKADGGVSICYDGNKYCAAPVEGNIIAGVDAPDATTTWQFISVEEALEGLYGATAENKKDATFMIKAANFCRNHYTVASDPAWTVDAGCTNKNLNGGARDNTCAESWHSKFNIHQTVTGLPNGKYELTAQGFWRQDGSDTENIPVFYANDVEAQFPTLTGSENSMTDASASFTQGLYKIDPIVVEVTDGTLTLGVKNDNSTVWCIWDNFELTAVDVKEPVDVTSFVGNYLVDATVTGNNVTAEFKGQTIKVEAGAKAGTVNVILPATEWKGHSMAQTELAGVAVTETEKADTYSLNVVGQKITVDDTEFTVTEESTITYELGDPAILTAVIKATSNKGDIEVVYNTAAPVDVTSFVGEYLVDATVTGNNVTAEFKGQTIKVEAGAKAGTVNVILPATEWKGHSMAQTELAGVAVTETEKADTYSLNAVGQKITVDDTEFTVTEESTITYELGDPAILTAVIKATSDKGDIEVVYNTAATVEPSEVTIYSWESPAGDVIQTGGTIKQVNGTDDRINYSNSGYHTVCLNGKKNDLNTAYMVITLEEGLKENDQINITAYRTKNDPNATASIFMQFENGTEFAGVEGGLFWTNIYIDTDKAPNTYTWTVPAAEEGAKNITLTRNATGTNLFITKIEITRDASTAVGSVEAAEVAAPAVKKVFVDGQLIIFKDGKQYSATGAQMK